MYHKVLQVHTCALTKWKIVNHEVVIPMTLIAGHSWDSYMFLMFKWCTSLCCSWVSTSYISIPFFHYYLILHYTVPLLFHLLRYILFHVQLDVWTSTDIYMNWNVFAWMLDLLGDPDLPCCFLSVSLLCSLCKHVGDFFVKDIVFLSKYYYKLCMIMYVSTSREDRLIVMFRLMVSFLIDEHKLCVAFLPFNPPP